MPSEFGPLPPSTGASASRGWRLHCPSTRPPSASSSAARPAPSPSPSARAASTKEASPTIATRASALPTACVRSPSGWRARSSRRPSRRGHHQAQGTHRRAEGPDPDVEASQLLLTIPNLPADHNLFLIHTAGVPLTSLYTDEIIASTVKPLCMHIHQEAPLAKGCATVLVRVSVRAVTHGSGAAFPGHSCAPGRLLAEAHTGAYWATVAPYPLAVQHEPVGGSRCCAPPLPRWSSSR